MLNSTSHRPWPLPSGNWKYYQEWNDAIFLHFAVDYSELRKFVPKELEIDLMDGQPWVSIVIFRMQKIRPRYLPSVAIISDFDEINIRTYVKHGEKSGVYFLSIEAGNKVSARIAAALSGLPYRFSKMRRSDSEVESRNSENGDSLSTEYQVGDEVTDKSEFDLWLTERYALFQESGDRLYSFDIHHLPWPLHVCDVRDYRFEYPRFDLLLESLPLFTHYSPGVQVIAWARRGISVL